MAFKEFYLIWVCAVYFTQCGIFVITPTAVAKCFGQKNFSSIYGSMFLLNVKQFHSYLAFLFIIFILFTVARQFYLYTSR